MEIILKDNLKGLGYKNDLVTVKPGYGRNYLIPKGLAVIADASAKKVLAENIRQAAHKAEKMKTEAENLAAGIDKLNIEIKAKVGDNDKIFGSVTTVQLAEALKSSGFDIDRKEITISDNIKTTGEFQAVIDLHKEVQYQLKFKVIAE